MGLSVVVPHKGKGLYPKAEIKKFLYETGRTFGILQYDPEPSLKTLIQSVVQEVGGMSTRATPVNWKQAHGSIGKMQSTFYAQTRALLLQLEKDYNCTIAVKSPLFPWVVKHAPWTLNRYLEHSDGRASYERRWGRKYNHAVCTFGETILFKNPSHNFKASSAWERGIWLGKDTESEEHIVGTKEGARNRGSFGHQAAEDFMYH